MLGTERLLSSGFAQRQGGGGTAAAVSGRGCGAVFVPENRGKEYEKDSMTLLPRPNRLLFGSPADELKGGLALPHDGVVQSRWRLSDSLRGVHNTVGFP